MIKYPKYYRLLGRCIKRTSETTGMEILLPDNPVMIFPLSMGEVTYPDKARFDEAIAKMEETDQEVWEQYIYRFLGRVEEDINKPMWERAIKKHQMEYKIYPARK